MLDPLSRLVSLALIDSPFSTGSWIYSVISRNLNKHHYVGRSVIKSVCLPHSSFERNWLSTNFSKNQLFQISTRIFQRLGSVQWNLDFFNEVLRDWENWFVN